MSVQPDARSFRDEMAAERERILDRLREATDDEGHYYGAWSGGSKAQGGGPVRAGGGGAATSPVKPAAKAAATAGKAPSTPKETPKSKPKDPTASYILTKDEAFKKEGFATAYAAGSGTAASPGREKAKKELDATIAMLPAGKRQHIGPQFSRAAFASPNVIVAKTKTGDGVAGALGYTIAPLGGAGLGGKSLYIDFLGTTGIADGTGSALARMAIKEAARQKLPITLDAITSARPFWAKMGMSGEAAKALEGPYSYHWGMSAKDVQRIAADL